MFIKRENIFFDFKNLEKYEILQEMVKRSNLENNLKEYVYAKIVEREKLQSTYAGNKIGVAHARVSYLDKIEILLGILPNDVNYMDKGVQNVNIVFIVLVPHNQKLEYLKVLSKISKICRNNYIMTELRKYDNKAKILDIFSEVAACSKIKHIGRKLAV